MVEIHVYGKLRRYVNDGRRGSVRVIRLQPRSDETVTSLLAKMRIPVDEINHIFVNAQLLVSRNSVAPYLGYPQSRSDLSDWDLNVPVGVGDRIGIFGMDMGMLGM